MANSIKTVGQLREFLANMLIGLKDGTIKPNEASQMQKMAAQINESFYSEVKVLKLRRDMGEETALPTVGDLPINK